MAKITKGILGGGRGKVANVVMGNWKGIDYIRAYAVPSNPRSPAQVSRRNILTTASKKASELNKFFSRIPDELPKLSNYNILVRRLISGANFYTACLGFGTRNDIPTTANLSNISGVVISGSFVAGDKIVLGFFGVDGGPELIEGSGKVFQVTVSASTATSVTINASSFPDGDYDDYMVVWTTVRGGQANIVAFNKSF
jgi:hypothetical protein